MLHFSDLMTNNWQLIRTRRQRIDYNNCFDNFPQDKKTTGRFLVRFEDGDERSVHEEDLIVCELLPVGMNVLVQRDEEGWSEPALILGHWKAGELKGYKVEYEDNSKGR